MELWDLYRQNRQPVGCTHIRGNKIPQGLYHLVVHIWIRNANGYYLISQRSPTRPTFPLMWECVCGSVLQGETSLDAALREVKEELGVTLAPESGLLKASYVGRVVNGIAYPEIQDIWIFHYDGEVDLKNATTDEVCQSKWVTMSQIEELFFNHQFAPVLNYFSTEFGR